MTTSSVSDAYAEGYDAYIAGRSEASNPYEIDSSEYLSWIDGFIAAEGQAP